MLLSLPGFFDPEVVGAALTVLFCAGLWIAMICMSVFATSYQATSERLLQRKGLISRKTSEIEMSDIRNVQVNQNVLQRLLGIGNVGVSTSGQADVEINFVGIRDPQIVADRIRAQRKRNEAGMAR